MRKMLSSPFDMTGQVSTMPYIDRKIASAVQNQCGHADRWQHVPDVDGVIHGQECLRSPWAGTCAARTHYSNQNLVRKVSHWRHDDA
jgi:hypothetical protein